ncbi:sarcoplasmic calcium-binding protein-like [Ruditapes philippinarum]|uniref:sarcoplasmic calcium-binding protein-like n=1 Tax=Ruditapes philippinarum TaxID=129788 RepID=UPI00295AB15A|nr:sarcoplasmic calcium-binding protein-like [Ruditapes philippinarum]
MMWTMTNIKAYSLLVLYFNTAAGSVNVESDTSKANEYLIEKWEKLYTSNDFNHDGVLSMDDIKLFEKFYKDLDYLSDEHLTEIEKRMDRIWRSIMLNNTKEITKVDFTEMMKERYEADKSIFIEMIRDYISGWCETMDLNNDSFISKEEFLTDMFASQHNDTAKDDEMFLAFNPVNGRIPVEEIINYFIRFATEKNESTSDIFETAMDTGA